jgi:hypothetical protein
MIKKVIIKITVVLIWDLEDYQTRLSTSYMLSGKRELNQISGGDNNMKLN